MLELPRIPPARQRIVGLALAEYIAQKPSVPGKVLTSAQRVIQAGEALVVEREGPPMPLVDNSADAVVSAFWRGLDDDIRALDSTVIPVEGEQAAVRDAAIKVRDAAFGRGIKFIHLRYSLEWDALLQIKSVLEREDIRNAIAILGKKAIVAHLLQHIDLYGKILGATKVDATSTTEQHASEAFHEAFLAFVVDVHSEISDAGQRRALLGIYEAQLAEHREDLQKARRKAPQP